MTDDLVAFLHAQLDADEHSARSANGRTWNDDRSAFEDRAWIVNEETWLFETDPATVQHIARHDPARVLADVKAKRAILDLHVDRGECTRCERFDGELYPCETLRLLALPHATHPDYRKEWTP